MISTLKANATMQNYFSRLRRYRGFWRSYFSVKLSASRSRAEKAEVKAKGQSSLTGLMAIFFWIGATSLGGKPSAFFYDALVKRRGWLRSEDYVEGQTIARLLPGATANTLVMYIAQRLYGSLAAVACLISSALPGALIILALSVWFMTPDRPLWLDGAVRAVAAAAVGLLFANLVQTMPTARAARAWPVIALLTFIGTGVLRFNFFLVFVVLCIVSLGLNRPQSRGGQSHV